MTQSVAEVLEGAHNLAVLGATQTGKTSFARELHAETSRVSIWVNERGKHRVPNVEGRSAETLSAVKRMFADDRYRIEYLPSDRRAAIPALQSWLWDVAERTNRKLPVQVVVDEVDRVAEQSGEKYGNNAPRDAVRDFTSEGVKRNVKFVGITQDPTTYDKKALRQSRYRAVWPMSAENRRSLSGYGFDWDRIDESPQYAGVLHHMSGNIVGTVKAEERYA